MIEEKSNASTYVFGLDIGTRGIAKMAGYRNLIYGNIWKYMEILHDGDVIDIYWSN